MNPKVSILVPIYNVSAFIEKCTHSLFGQTFSDIEYIFVNDASTDNSIEKLIKDLEAYPNRRSQIKVIHHTENKGLAVARNTAIDASSGDYLLAMDSDDYIELNMIEALYSNAIKHNADIAVCDATIEYSNKSILYTNYIPKISTEYFAEIIANPLCYWAIWNKLIKRELYLRNDCRVPEGLNFLEDRHTMTRIYYYAKKIIKVDQILYHYVKYNTNAITATRSRMHFENTQRFWELLNDFLIDKKEQNSFKSTIEFAKAQAKITLLIDTNSLLLRKEYSHLFEREERFYFSTFKRGEKIMSLLVRYRFFYLAQIFNYLLKFKNRNT